MKVLKYIFFLLLIAIIGTAIYIAVQPNTYDFNRSRVIKAPASVLFNKVNDYKNWQSFSPWLELEPNAKLTFKEKTSGVDGGYGWNGELLGEGSMLTTAVEDNKSITQKLNFIKPFESESNVTWNFEPTPEGTKVTWGMNGNKDFMTKMYTTFAGSIEKTTGPDYERGLAKLDSVARADMAKYSIKISGVTEHPGGYYIYNKGTCKIPDFDKKMKELFPKVGNYVMQNKIEPAGIPYVLYTKWDEKNNTVEFSCCMPIKEKVRSTDKSIFVGKLKPFKGLKTTLYGDYKNLKEAWEKSFKHIEDDKSLTLIENGPMLETYLTDPSKLPNPANWVTEVYIAVK